MDTRKKKGWWDRNWKWFVPVLGLGFFALLVCFVSLILSLVFGMMKSSHAYQLAMDRVRADSKVEQAIGAPIKAGAFVSGSIRTSGTSGHADLSIPISGSKGAATVYVVAAKRNGEWSFRELVVQEKGSGRRINLLFDEEDPRVGSVTAKHGEALYGTAIEYAKDIYLGRVSAGDYLLLQDTSVLWNEFDLPIIKVKVLEGRESGSIGWVGLKSTSFIDFYDPVLKNLDPSRASLRGLDQSQIDGVLKKQRSAD